MVDVDDFKSINDSHGHEIGDRVLIKIAETLKTNFRSDDCICRVGGDEFVVVLSGIDLASRDVLFDRFRKGMRTDGYLKEWDRVSAAMGCAIYDPAKDRSAESVLSNLFFASLRRNVKR